MATLLRDYVTRTIPPPLVGELQADVWPAGAGTTALNVDTGPDVAALMALVSGDTLRVVQADDATWWEEFDVTGAPVELSTYVSIPVVFTARGDDVPGGLCELVLPAAPEAGLGPRDVYASMEDLEAVVGSAAGAAQTRRRELALVAATRWVAYRVGAPVTDELLDETPPAGVVRVPARASWTTATVEAAVRFYKGPDVPWGVAGGWDEAVYVRQSMPEVELILFGQRSRWGIA